jgi:hypothetical protein
VQSATETIFSGFRSTLSLLNRLCLARRVAGLDLTPDQNAPPQGQRAQESDDLIALANHGASLYIILTPV